MKDTVSVGLLPPCAPSKCHTSNIKQPPMFTRSQMLAFMIGGLTALAGGYAIYFMKVMSMSLEIHTNHMFISTLPPRNMPTTILLPAGQKPEVKFVANSRLGQFVLDKCPVVHETFSPSWWAGSSLLQTIVPTMLRTRLDQMRFTREVIDCLDGGAVSLDWFEGSPSSESTAAAQASQTSQSSPQLSSKSPIAIMFPGLIGDSQSEYLRHIVPSLHKLGYRVACFNNRGRGGMELKTPRFYCAANFDDIELAINHVRANNPSSRIVASGFSMGGMVLTRYLAERGDQAKVDAAMLVSANYDLVNGTKNMEDGYVHRFVAKIMTKALVDVLWQDKETFSRSGKPVEWDKLRSSTSFRELDRYFTCPMWGYANPEEYQKDATNNERIPKIRVPTLALNSGDDIFSPYETLPLDRLTESTVFVVTQRGGHLGFMDGWIPSVPYYGDRLIEQFYKAMLSVDDPRTLAKLGS